MDTKWVEQMTKLKESVKWIMDENERLNNQLLQAEKVIVELRKDRDYWRDIAQVATATGGRG